MYALRTMQAAPVAGVAGVAKVAMQAGGHGIARHRLDQHIVQGTVEQRGGDDPLMLRRLKVCGSDRKTDRPGDLALRVRLSRVTRLTRDSQPHQRDPTDDCPAYPPRRHRYP
jgi:hypothetical protein